MFSPTRAPSRIRLDVLTNPFGPSERVFDAIASDNPRDVPDVTLATRLREELGVLCGVPASWIVLANGIDELHAMIARWRSNHGPLITFPPSDPELEAWIGQYGGQVERIPRLSGFRLPIEVGDSGLPKGATALVMSPNDPSGSIISVQDVVRLVRQCAVVVIDERHAAYSSRSILPLAREFETLVVVQTMETFAGLTSLPLAWAVAPPKMAREIERQARPSGVPRLPLVAALATLEDHDQVMRSVQWVMHEKSRLFRQIRKLNMISPPYPSWGNFLLCRFERGSSDFFVPRLAERGIDVYHPPHDNLRNHVRISAVSAEWTQALKKALIDIALEL
jgi:histidinol-phosphate aminotransferase